MTGFLLTIIITYVISIIGIKYLTLADDWRELPHGLLFGSFLVPFINVIIIAVILSVSYDIDLTVKVRQLLEKMVGWIPLDK